MNNNIQTEKFDWTLTETVINWYRFTHLSLVNLLLSLNLFSILVNNKLKLLIVRLCVFWRVVNYLQNPSYVLDIVYVLVSIHVTPSWLDSSKQSMNTNSVSRTNQRHENRCIRLLTAKPDRILPAVSSVSLSIFPTSVFSLSIAKVFR